MRRVAVALLHHPVLDRQGAIITTAITNLDLHDIARSAHSYGLERYFVVHPVAAQRDLALRVRSHWVEGSGARRIPDRTPALALLNVVASFDEALGALDDDGAGGGAEAWVTSARTMPGAVGFAAARQRLGEEGPAVLLCFGTGWGLGPKLFERAALRLEPIGSARADGYNRLSVRAAAAIIFDRLLGRP